jgi:hypothetical protein
MHRQGRIETLHAGDLRLGEAFSLSYQQLSPSAQLMLHRITAGEPPATPSAQAALAELIEVGLLNETPSGSYEMHGLVEEFARTMNGPASSATT